MRDRRRDPDPAAVFLSQNHITAVMTEISPWLLVRGGARDTSSPKHGLREGVLEEFLVSLWLSERTLAPDDLASNASPASSWLCDLKLVTSQLCASISPSVKWEGYSTNLIRLGGLKELVFAKCLEQ